MRTLAARIGLNPLPSPRWLLRGLLPGHGGAADGRRILVTGASSGVGRAAARALAAEGATVLTVARRSEELAALSEEISAGGGASYPLPCDLTDAEAVDALTARVLDRFGGVDVLVNNAGHSIRRSAAETAARQHDYERLMRLNYHAPVRLTLNLLPAMREQGGGHVINSSTWGVPGGLMPNFTAYHASKAALAAFARSLQAEERRHGIAVTSLHFPLMRTPMIAPTEEYGARAALEPEEAAAWVVHAVRHRPAELKPTYASVLQGVQLVSPGLAERLVTAARP